MAEVARRRESVGWPEIMDWFERGMPTLWRGATSAPGMAAIRVEDFVEEGAYVVRAELPGIDPAKDVEVTVSDGVLTIRAERKEEHKETQRSEFRYGSFQRSMTLPAGVDEEQVSATYGDGILTVKVPLPAEEKAEARRIEVQKA